MPSSHQPCPTSAHRWADGGERRRAEGVHQQTSLLLCPAGLPFPVHVLGSGHFVNFTIHPQTLRSLAGPSGLPSTPPRLCSAY